MVGLLAVCLCRAERAEREQELTERKERLVNKRFFDSEQRISVFRDL